MATTTGSERRKTRKQLEAQCYAWNAKHRQGVVVIVQKDGGGTLRTTTRSEAFVLEGHTAVIFVTMISGCYALDRVTAEKRDGLDQQIVSDALYYVQDSRTINGDCMSWWRPRGADYTANLDMAGTYHGRDVLSMRETDVPWPAELVEKVTMRHVRWDVLREAASKVQAVADCNREGVRGPCPACAVLP